MKKIRKIGLRVLVVLVALGAAYIGFNQIDAPPARFDIGEGLDTSSLQSLADSLWGQPSFDKNNGYYRLWSLTEPEAVDIESDELLLKYRRMHDPQFDNDKYLKEWLADENTWSFPKKDMGYYKKYILERKEILKKSGTFDSFAGASTRDWTRLILSQKESVLELKSLYQVFLDRYQKLVDSEIFEDFTIVRYDTTVPHLLAWLHVAKLYNTVNMLDALEGDWEKGVSHLLDHAELAKKAIKTSRTIILNLVAKAVLRESLHGLASLMNEPEFPKALYKKVINGLPPIKHEEYGTKGLVVEVFDISQVKKRHLLLQKNRTQQYFYNFFSKLVNSEKIPPYQWKSHPMENNSLRTGWTWWLQNPAGKIIFDKSHSLPAINNLFTVVFKSYSLKAAYDMTRISAELHFNYVPGKPVQEILESLETYRTWVDLGSGKPYIWNQQKQILYSIGVDRDDDGGKIDLKSLDTDFALPVILYIRNKN
ncbi:MAG: hypothetical protein JSV88_26910 [Candidatus Aminicenantes bacterium]|nr:MAG: hypothetical protein JSV88_26910 [Candidatus Aminicenantes bacterium]